MTNFVLHKAETRGHADHGWLNAWHSFSFAGYYDPARIHFGTLRVLNDDTVKGGMGFGMHPHDNMEIITIPLSGSLEHKDSMNNIGVINSGDVQVMSAGTGVFHSEYNKNPDKDVNLLQIWVMPKVRNVAPRYEQRTYKTEDRRNSFQQIISPDGEGDSMMINQDAWFSLTELDKDVGLTYTIRRKGNGLYAFVIDGDLTINDQKLHRRDAIGISDTESVSILAHSPSSLLLMDIPMQINN
jgi:quercetin 2,3-dioxygenase